MTAGRPLLRAILWDIDGTLLDSEPWHQHATTVVCRRFGCVLTDEQYAATLGIAFSELYALVQAIHPMATSLEAWIDAITDCYIERIAEVTPRDGSLALVEAFAARGLPQACVSNAGRRVVEANLRRLGAPHFAFGVSRDDVKNGKPDPESYRLAAQRLGVPPESCAVIEDSPMGARAAKAAGMLTVAWPQHPGLVFEAADFIVAHPDDVDWDALCATAEDALCITG